MSKGRKLLKVFLWLRRGVVYIVLPIFLFLATSLFDVAANMAAWIVGQTGFIETPLNRERAKTAELENELDDHKRQNRALRERNDQLMNERLIEVRGERKTIREATNETIERTRVRASRTAIANVSSAPAESIPFFGASVVVAATTYEITMACQTLSDLYELQAALDPDSAVPDDRDTVCGLQVPTRDEIWQSIKQSPSAVWEASKDGLERGGAYVAGLKTPDFGLVWASFLEWLDDLL